MAGPVRERGAGPGPAPGKPEVAGPGLAWSGLGVERFKSGRARPGEGQS